MSHYTRPAVRKLYPAAMPKFWRPKLAASDQLTCKVIHWDLITTFAAGKATEQDMLDWIETGLTYAKMAELLMADGVPVNPEAVQALNDQAAIYEDVIGRHRKTGRVGFSGYELTVARLAASIMDELIQLDRHGIAGRAAVWGTERMRLVRRGGKLPSPIPTEKSGTKK